MDEILSKETLEKLDEIIKTEGLGNYEEAIQWLLSQVEDLRDAAIERSLD